MDLIRRGFFNPATPDLFHPLIDVLLTVDRFRNLNDFEAYHQAQMQIDQTYRSIKAWTRKSILNVARMGWFSSDRTIAEYNRDIWHAETVTVTRDDQK